MVKQPFSASCWGACCGNLVKIHTSRLVAYSLRNLHSAGGHCLTTWGLCCAFQCPVVFFKMMLTTKKNSTSRNPRHGISRHIFWHVFCQWSYKSTIPQEKHCMVCHCFLKQTNKTQEIVFYVTHQGIRSLIIFNRPQTANFIALFPSKVTNSTMFSKHFKAYKCNYINYM